MSAGYNADLTIKVKDEKGAIKALNAFIDAKGKGLEPFGPCNFHLAECKEKGIGRETLPDLISIIMGGYQEPLKAEKVKDGFITYTKCFNASYSWREVLDGMFEELAPFIEDGSSLDYDSDDYHAGWQIVGGEVC